MTEQMMAMRIFVPVCIAVGGLFTILNWMWFYLTWRFHSLVPLLGAVSLCTGLALLPQTRHFTWMAIPPDCGTCC